jgi:hypothetical protein
MTSWSCCQSATALPPDGGTQLGKKVLQPFVLTIMLSMTPPSWFVTVQFWAYRAGGFVVLNVLDDPAWLAMIFC